MPFSPLPPVRTATAIPLATCASGTKNFSPVIVYSLPALGRLELDAFGVETARGFGEREGADKLALRHPRQNIFLLLIGSAFNQQRRPEQRGGEKWSRDQRLAGFFDDHRHVEEAAALSAVTLRGSAARAIRARPASSRKRRRGRSGPPSSGGQTWSGSCRPESAWPRPETSLVLQKIRNPTYVPPFCRWESCGLKPLRSMFQVPLRVSNVQAAGMPRECELHA